MWRREPSDWLRLTNPPTLRRDQQGATVGQMSRRSGSRKLSAAWPAHYKTLIPVLAHNDLHCHHHCRQWTMALSLPVVQWEFTSECDWRDNGMQPEPKLPDPSPASVHLKRRYMLAVIVSGIIPQVDSLETTYMFVFGFWVEMSFQTIHSTDAIHASFYFNATTEIWMPWGVRKKRKMWQLLRDYAPSFTFEEHYFSLLPSRIHYLVIYSLFST